MSSRNALGSVELRVVSAACHRMQRSGLPSCLVMARIHIGLNGGSLQPEASSLEHQLPQGLRSLGSSILRHTCNPGAVEHLGSLYEVKEKLGWVFFGLSIYLLSAATCILITHKSVTSLDFFPVLLSNLTDGLMNLLPCCLIAYQTWHGHTKLVKLVLAQGFCISELIPPSTQLLKLEGQEPFLTYTFSSFLTSTNHHIWLPSFSCRFFISVPFAPS